MGAEMTSSVPTALTPKLPEPPNEFHPFYFDYLEALAIIKTTSKDMSLSAYGLAFEYDLGLKLGL
jgi:hypothetical protein